MGRRCGDRAQASPAKCNRCVSRSWSAPGAEHDTLVTKDGMESTVCSAQPARRLSSIEMRGRHIERKVWQTWRMRLMAACSMSSDVTVRLSSAATVTCGWWLPISPGTLEGRTSESGKQPHGELQKSLLPLGDAGSQETDQGARSTNTQRSGLPDAAGESAWYALASSLRRVTTAAAVGLSD